MQQCVDPEGDWREDLPAMNSFRAQAIEFENAVSCGVGTTMSLPNLLFQRSPKDYSSNSWRDSWFDVSPRAFTNGILFSAKQNGYTTALVGTYLPFGQMFASLLDGGLDLPLHRFIEPRSFGRRIANQLVCLMAFARGPFGGQLLAGIPRLRYLPSRLDEKYFEQTTHRAQAAIRAELKQMNRNGQFFFAYMAIPHSPAIFLADGEVDSIRATYDSQLRYADKVFGDYLNTMKINGTYDDSWVILTADHGHHGFKLSPDAHRHVPFIVKAPGAAFAQPVSAEIHLWELAPFFKAVFQEESIAHCLEALPVQVNTGK